MSLRVVRLGTTRIRGEGLRIGTVRRPPRGVPKERHAEDDWYDVWLPVLAPSSAAIKEALAADSEITWAAFLRRYKKEMKSPEARHAISLLAALSHRTDLSVGCYCKDEDRCHRSILGALLIEAGAKIE